MKFNTLLTLCKNYNCFAVEKFIGKTYLGKLAVLLLVHLEKTIEIRVEDLLQVIKTNEKFLE